jgi:hypothetical protein
VSRWRRQRSGQGHGVAAIGAEHDAAVNLEPGEAIAWLSVSKGSLLHAELASTALLVDPHARTPEITLRDRYPVEIDFVAAVLCIKHRDPWFKFFGSLASDHDASALWIADLGALQMVSTHYDILAE